MIKPEVYQAVKLMKLAILYGFQVHDPKPWLRWML